jgi:hypothetical protein
MKGVLQGSRANLDILVGNLASGQSLGCRLGRWIFAVESAIQPA